MFEYNTDRPQIMVKGYGRIIQQMVENLKNIPDLNARTDAANAIVRVISQFNISGNVKLNDGPSYKMDEAAYSQSFWRKIWQHLYMISNYQLEINPPYTILEPNKSVKPVISHYYNKSKINLRTYGRSMQEIIKKVSEYPENERNFWAIPLANQLKKLYLFYNRNSVTDELIINQLKQMSDGKIVLPEGTQLNSTRDILKVNNYYQEPKGYSKSSKSKRKRTRR